MTSATENLSTVDDALQQFRDMIASDGYLVSWTELADRHLVVQIDAGADACADCLVPQPVMEAIISKSLEPTPYTLDHVVLPADH